MRRKEETVWNHFDKSFAAEGRSITKCKDCKRVLEGHRASNAMRHLKTFHSELSARVEAVKGEMPQKNRQRENIMKMEQQESPFQALCAKSRCSF